MKTTTKIQIFYFFQTKLSEYQAVADGGGGVLQPALSTAPAGKKLNTNIYTTKIHSHI